MQSFFKKVVPLFSYHFYAQEKTVAVHPPFRGLVFHSFHRFGHSVPFRTRLFHSAHGHTLRAAAGRRQKPEAETRLGVARRNVAPHADGSHRLGGQPLCRASRLRLRGNQESRQGAGIRQAETRRKHHIAANGQERLPVALIIMAQERTGSLFHGPHRNLLEQGAHHGSVPQLH